MQKTFLNYQSTNAGDGAKRRKIQTSQEDLITMRFKSRMELKRQIELMNNIDELLLLEIPEMHQKSVLPLMVIPEMEQRPDYPDPSPIKISVMTIICYLTQLFNTKAVFCFMDVIDFARPTTKQMDILEGIDFQGSEYRECCAKKLNVHEKIAKIRKWQMNKNELEEKKFLTKYFMSFMPGILDIQVKNMCRGNTYFGEPKKKKQERKTSFGNQCTMRICISNEKKGKSDWNIINLKIFQNGKIQMTGSKRIGDGRIAVNLLIKQVKQLSEIMIMKRCVVTEIKCFPNTLMPSEIHDAMTKFQIPQEIKNIMTKALKQKPIVEKIILKLDNESLFECTKVCKLFRRLIYSERFWKLKTENELRCVIAKMDQGYRVTSKYNRKYKKYRRVNKSAFYPTTFKIYKRSLNKLTIRKPFLPVYSYQDLEINDEVIPMINSDFVTNFCINVDILKHILLKPPYNLRVRCDYSPQDHPGLNIKYNLKTIPKQVWTFLWCLKQKKIGMNKDMKRLLLKYWNPYKTIAITIFVFGSGSVLINSAKNVTQLDYAYRFINSILKREYEKIWIPLTF